MNDAILNIKNLKVWYNTYRGYAKVVDGVNFHVGTGEKVGLVGESGCGKTTTMKSVLRVIDSSINHIPEGEILYRDKDILKMNYNDLQQIRKKSISMISQAPSAALNPVFTVGEQLLDVIRYSEQYNKKSGKKDLMDMAVSAIKDVMISDPERILKSYPHQLSGGMKQRICIAMSLVTPRELLIADEPGTALDVTIQDQIHRLLRALVEEKGRSLIMITHSLGVARELVDRIYVMYAGNIVEVAKTKDLFSKPLHPYTKGLMECVPRLSGGGVTTGIYGYIPNYINPAPGCRFCPRCPDAMDICSKEKPQTIEISDGHKVACFKYTNS
ncbi:MAG: peptide ABC transporter ATP-binding protein [Clostridia bacterium BRH_c25]|nr:MAG: peptide ABC transporter ATP-binding protein [Clostridia bacterium BRH_c25]